MALHPCPHCGHPISEKAEQCPACHQDPRVSPEELAQRNAAKKAKRKRALLIGGICAAVVLTVGVPLCALFLPDYLDYRTACNLLEQQKYVEAAEAFDAMADYRDSAQQALESRYQYVAAHKTRDDKQTRDYLHELVDAAYKDAAAIEDEIYAWHITVYPCASKTGGAEKYTFRTNEPLYFIVDVKGGHIAEHRSFRYEATLYPTPYWQANGVSSSTHGDNLGIAFDGGDTLRFGWENGLDGSVIGSVSFFLYDAETNVLIDVCSAFVY